MTRTCTSMKQHNRGGDEPLAIAANSLYAATFDFEEDPLGALGIASSLVVADRSTTDASRVSPGFAKSLTDAK